MTVLTKNQKRLLVAIHCAAAVILANSAYLYVTTPREAASRIEVKPYEVTPYGKAGLETIGGAAPAPLERDLPWFYQGMLLAHIFGGLLLLGIAGFFVVWHLRNALKRRNRQAIRLGLSLVAVAVCLGVSGLFILTEASSTQHRWIFRGHQILALLVPLLYIGHRMVSSEPPAARQIGAGAAIVIALFLLFLGGHRLEVSGVPAPGDAFGDEKGDPRPPAALVPRPDAGPAAADPFMPYRAQHLGAPDSPFFPSRVTTASGKPMPRRTLTQEDLSRQDLIRADIGTYGFVVNDSMGSATCARCHASIVEQWSRSAHRFSSFNNLFYKASVENLRTEKDGKVRSQWCGGCHDPVLMFAGTMRGDVDTLEPESQAGLTCLSCHAIDAIHGKAANGNYNISDETPSPYLFAMAKVGPPRILHDMLVKSKPTVHKQQMLKPFFRASEFCMTCHKVSLDLPINDYRWLRGQNEYDNWHDSGVARNASRTFYLPPVKKVCQDCHMPLEPATLGDVSAKGGLVRSHRFLAVNTALPYIRGDDETIAMAEKFLQDEKLRVDIFALRRFQESASPPAASGEAEPPPAEAASVAAPLDRARPGLRPGEEVQVDVVVRNLGVGHTFPGGTNDSNEAWIDFEVAGEDGRVFYRSGAMGDGGRVDPAAHFYKLIFVDRSSQPVLKRDPQNFHAVVYGRVIGPGTADVARYRFQVPEEAAGHTLRLSARLMWRKFNRDFTEFVFSRTKLPGLPRFEGKTVPELPVTRLAGAEVALEVAAAGAAPAPPRQEAVASTDWMRFNDYGIAHLLQADTRTAGWAFGRVAELVPERIDGPRNLARVAITEGRLEEAYTLLGRCEKIQEGDAQTAWFWGLARKEDGLYEEAVKAFRRVIAYFPEDRAAWREMARAYYLKGDYRQALDAFLEVLAIDPEDRVAHYHRMLCYRALGNEAAAEEARKAFDTYQIDESAQEKTQAYRRAQPIDNLESQAIHIHFLKP